MSPVSVLGLILFIASVRVALMLWREREQRPYWRGGLVAVLPMSVGAAVMMFVQGNLALLIMLACFVCQMVGVAMVVQTVRGRGPGA